MAPYDYNTIEKREGGRVREIVGDGAGERERMIRDGEKDGRKRKGKE